METREWLWTGRGASVDGDFGRVHYREKSWYEIQKDQEREGTIKDIRGTIYVSVRVCMCVAFMRADFCDGQLSLIVNVSNL